MRPVYPLPEATDGNPWVVRSGRGQCDTVGRVLSVPLGEGEADRFVRNHEVGHAKITPRVPAYKQCRKHGVSMTALQCCEDMRVHHFLTKAKVAMTGHLDFYDAQCLVRRQLGNERVLGASLCSAWETEDANRLINILSTLVNEDVLNQLLNKVRLINERLQMGKGIYRWIGMRNCTIPAARLFDTLFPENGERPGDYGNVPLQALKGRRTGGRWGEMEIQTLPQSMRRSISPIAQRRIFHNEGSRLVAPYRLPVDGRVFCQKKRQVGGTVLIDVSGSMSLSLQDLKKIVAVAPAATIAVYSGRGKSGTLTIIGERGRLVDDRGLQEACQSSGNIIDGPSLRWLSLQESPRIWVSDGLVTGEDDHHTIDLAVDAQRICSQAQIRRVGKAEAVADLLKAIAQKRRIGSSF
jgi:hypothetical protein